MNPVDASLPSRSAEAEPARSGELVRRHSLGTRIWHWTNAVCVFVMLMSGLMIFNAHPRLYWGQYGANPDHAWLVIGSTGTSGFLEVAGHRVATTGVLGHWRDPEGRIQRRAFPHWATIPSRYSLSSARRWHLTFAWLFAVSLALYLAAAFVTRHVQRDLVPRHGELAPRHIWKDIVDHALLRFPTGEASLRYNILQKLAYVGVLFVLLPLLVLTGLTMSPQMNAAWPWLLDLFGGRPSARSIHFILAFAIVLFILVHLVEAVLAGPINELRSMITGWYRVRAERKDPR